MCVWTHMSTQRKKKKKKSPKLKGEVYNCLNFGAAVPAWRLRCLVLRLSSHRGLFPPWALQGLQPPTGPSQRCPTAPGAAQGWVPHVPRSCRDHPLPALLLRGSGRGCWCSRPVTRGPCWRPWAAEKLLPTGSAPMRWARAAAILADSRGS